MKKRNYITLSAATAIILLAAGCGGGGGATQPSATSGVYTIQAKGGDSVEGSGGNSDYYGLSIYSESGIEVKKGGKVDASFSMPANPYVAHLGDNPKTVATDLNITSFENAQQVIDANLSAGTPYLIDGDGSLYLADADDNVSNDKTVSSLTIEAGTTVMFAPNFDIDDADGDGNHSTGADTVAFELTNDLVINGTLKTMPVETPAAPTADEMGNGDSMSSLAIYTEGAFIMGKGSLIDTSGEDAVEVAVDMVKADGNTSARGGSGGAVSINGYFYDGWAEYSDAKKSGIYRPSIKRYNLIRIEGTIDVSGGDGLGSGAGGSAGYLGDRGVSLGAGQFIMTSDGKIVATGGSGGQGGTGCNVYISASNDIYNAGKITTSGGSGSVAIGGHARSIRFASYSGSVYNSADLTAVGGDGNLTAGDGGNIYLSSDSGALYNTGNLTSNGGNSTASEGGDGRYIELYAKIGELKTSGNLIANGGKGKVSGGSGGYISIRKNIYDEVHADTNVEVSGNLSVNGGAATTKAGGDAGRVTISHRLETDDYGKLAIGGVVKLLGYDSIDVSGGSGGTYGENGGNVVMDVNTYYRETFASPLYLVNEADITAKGGQSLNDEENAKRNYAGYVRFYMGDSKYYGGQSGLGTSQAYLNNSGNIDISSSDAVKGAGDAGEVDFRSVGNLQNSGSVTGIGGDVNGTESYAGDGGSVLMWALNNATNNANMVLSGGNGDGNVSQGGDGGYVEIFALEKATSSGDIIVNGGNSNGKVDNTDGGHGGVWSSHGTSSYTAGSINVAAGTGGTGDKGDDGVIVVDGVDVTP